MYSESTILIDSFVNVKDLTPPAGSLAAYNRAMEDLAASPGAGSPDIYNNFRWSKRKGNGKDRLNPSDTTDTHTVLDLALVMDCTGSMGAWMEHSKNTLSMVLDNIKNDTSRSQGKQGIVH